MARNRQRAKQRQAERRAKRLSEQGGGPPRREQSGGTAGSVPGVDAPRVEPVETDGRDRVIDDPTTVDPSPAVPPELATGAPPQDEGRSDRVLEDEPELREDEAIEEIEDWELEDPEEAVAARAELQRVQWPNRQALVTLTGVVLGFVLIAGGYLGLLDAIFSELIQAIL